MKILNFNKKFALKSIESALSSKSALDFAKICDFGKSSLDFIGFLRGGGQLLADFGLFGANVCLWWWHFALGYGFGYILRSLLLCAKTRHYKAKPTQTR